ncbi:MAG: DNA cytosine methyltransferase, partial [Leptospiraceae bacterium]|nr:DNA cytosine methyltransferase [Leptospiraceae bacterium]
LRNLIDEGLIADGDVDTRSIADVRANDLTGYRQHHFFAGIGGWSLALRQAGWPDDRPVFTGSPPCQPFSLAGRQAGIRDERHLAPQWIRLVRALRPSVIFGEQVAAAVARDSWLDDLLDALEDEGYSTGAAVLPACSVGAPHIRQRLWFAGWLGNPGSTGLERLPGTEHCRSQSGRISAIADRPTTQAGGNHRMADSHLERRIEGRISIRQPGQNETEAQQPGATFWSPLDWLPCADGKARPIKPGIEPLAHGIPARMGRLRAYGNAIVPALAAEVIKTLMERMEVPVCS